MFNFLKKKFKDTSLEEQKKEIEKFPVEMAQLALNGLNCDVLPDATGDFGRCLTNPIPVNGPIGEIIYINRLRTSDGGLIFHRLGSSLNIDIYEVVSLNGKIWDILYLDMYHPRRSTIHPSGYEFSEFHEIFSRAPVGYCTNSFDPDFPFGLSVFIEKGFLGTGLAKRYEDVIKNKLMFIKPFEHVEKLNKIKITGQLY